MRVNQNCLLQQNTRNESISWKLKIREYLCACETKKNAILRILNWIVCFMQKFDGVTKLFQFHWNWWNEFCNILTIYCNSCIYWFFVFQQSNPLKTKLQSKNSVFASFYLTNQIENLLKSEHKHNLSHEMFELIW